MLGSHEPPAYGVCLIENESIVVHMRHFLDESPRFVLTDRNSKQAKQLSDLTPPPPEIKGYA
jgi:hypothetical protein